MFNLILPDKTLIRFDQSQHPVAAKVIRVAGKRVNLKLTLDAVGLDNLAHRNLPAMGNADIKDFQK